MRPWLVRPHGSFPGWAVAHAEMLDHFAVPGVARWILVVLRSNGIAMAHYCSPFIAEGAVGTAGMSHPTEM